MLRNYLTQIIFYLCELLRPVVSAGCEDTLFLLPKCRINKIYCFIKDKIINFAIILCTGTNTKLWHNLSLKNLTIIYTIKKMRKLILLAALLGVVSLANAQRVTDKLDRGLVAVPVSSGNYFVSWRKFGSEYYDTKYNLYRNGTLVKGDLEVTNYTVSGASASDTYQVEAVVRGVAQEKSAAVTPWATDYFDVPVQPVVNRAGKTIGNSQSGNSGGSVGEYSTSGYTLNDITLADVTGDGVCEFIVKRNNSQGNLRSASNSTDFNLYECYKLDGTRLWWIDLGPNLTAGADEQWDLIGYDWDEDGKAECLMRGADNMIIHTATGKTINIGDMTSGFGYERPEYMGVGKEYLLYMNGETGEPYGWDGSENWTPMAYPLPQFEANETYGSADVWGDLGHRMQKHYFGAPYLDGRHASIFLGRGCYTRHKMCALDVNPTTHELTQRWRWNCYDSSSPWFGNGFHNFAIADVDMDGRDEIMFGSMCIDDTGYGLSTTGLGHGDAQHCGDLDPYRWGLEQFTCQEGSEGNSYWNPTTGQIYYRKSDGGDDGRSLAGNFTNAYPGGQGRSVSSGVIGLSCNKVIDTNGDAMSGSYSNLNNRIYWDGDLLDEIFNSKNGASRPGHIFKWGGSQIKEFNTETITNNSTKCNPAAQGDILGDWREEIVLRKSDNSAMRIFTTTTKTDYAIYTLWHDHEYRNGMCWQNVGYNQPPHVSFFLGELEGITIAPPPLILDGRTEVANGGTIGTGSNEHLLVSGYENKTISVADGASPYILTVNAPAWVKGSGSQQATSSTPKSPARTVETYTTTLTGGAFSGATRIIKQGEGVLVLPNVVEKHTGETNIWNGTLQFDGTFQSSPLWLNRHTTLISNGGSFLGGLKADYNATIFPGGKSNVGSITTTTLALGFGSRIVFDANGESFDQVNCNELTIEAKTEQVWLDFGPTYKAPVFEFTSTPATGKYLLGNVAKIEGNINDINLEGLGNVKSWLTLEDGKLYLNINALREAGAIVWNGTESLNIWDFGFSESFLLGTTATYSAQGDDITFDDNAAYTTVNIKGGVAPKSVTFNNETKAYVINGDSIIGGAPIVKNGAGTVTINSYNRSGATTINGGKLVVSMLANKSGQSYGSLGNSSQSITINDGATLQTNGVIITDQPINISGNANIAVPSGMTFSTNNSIRGTNAVLTKTGTGTMTTGAGNTYSKLVISEGRVNAIHQNNVDQLPATVEFGNGTLWGANYEDTPGITNTANFVVPKGKSGTFYGSYRGTYRGTLTGEGTFTAYTGGLRCYFDGDWSQFTGTINARKNNRQNKKSYVPVWAFRNAKGMPYATLDVGANVLASNEGNDIEVAKVTGTGYLTGSGKWIINLTSANQTLPVHVGVPKAFSAESYAGDVAVSKTYLVKRGDKALKLSTPTESAPMVNADVTVEEGKLYFNDTNASLYMIGASNTLTVQGTGRVAGQGRLYNLNIKEGGSMIPCSATLATTESTPATMLVAMTTTVDEGGTVEFIINSSKNSVLRGYNVTFNGTVKVNVPSSFTAMLGTEYQLINASGKLTGTPTFDLPELGNGLDWDTSEFMSTGKLKIVEATAIKGIANGATVNCELYTLGGQLVGSFNTTAGAATQQAQKMPLRQGTYIMQVTDGKKVVTKKVNVR